MGVLETETHYIKSVSPGGRVKYTPVEGYQWMDRQQWPDGDHVIHIDGNSGSYSYHIDPDNAAIEAAIMAFRNDLTNALADASRPRRPTKISAEERLCWDAYEEKSRELGLDPYPPTLMVESVAGIVDDALKVFRQRIVEAKQ